MTDHPITPPPELVQQWAKDRALLGDDTPLHLYIANRAAQWGANQELEACCSLINLAHSDPAATGDHRLVDKTVLLKQLRTARRPSPPSLKEQALAELEKVDTLWDTTEFGRATLNSFDIIRHALEQLDN